MTIEAAVDAAAAFSRPAEYTCGCGQALDLCHAAHCPRCGTTLHG